MAKVLVVDDEPLLRAMLRDALESAGYTVLVAVDGRSGLLTAKAERPDCILLDIIMPGLDGYETCKLLKADPELKPIPVFLISATTDLRVVDNAENVGAAGIFPKPISTEQIQHAVAMAIAGSPSA